MNTKTKSKLLKTAEQIEKKLFELNDLFAENTATLYSTHGETVNVIETGSDVYELIETARPAVFEIDEPIALTVAGWAAPIDDNPENLAPSQHPNRRRVSLFILVNQAGQMASVLRFNDTPNETTTDDGEAAGSLAEALLDLIQQ